VDGRDQTLPSIAFNIPYLVPASSSDVDRIEVARGPAGAIYGPNTERGVAQIITRSPFDAPGTTLSLDAGGRDLFQAELRQAGVVGAKWGYKVTGDYLSGTDWVYADTAGEAAPRDPKLQRYAAGGQLEYRPGPDAALKAGVGYAQAVSAVDLEPTLGPIQLKNWGFGNADVQYTRKSLLGRLSYTWNSSGDSYGLTYGNHLTDLSRMLVAQVKAGGALGSVPLQYGGDFHYTNPVTNRSIDGANEQDDQVAEVGAFVLGERALGVNVNLSAALRADYNDRIGTVGLAPRLGVVYQPTPTQAIRLTYGRGYTTPTPPDFFADIPVIDSLGGLPYALVFSGIPPGGYQFRRDCGGLCMRSPFASDPAAFQPIDAAAYWNDAVNIVYEATGGAVDLHGIPAPTSAEVGSVLRTFDLQDSSFSPVPTDPASITDYPTETRETTDAIELGYKAALGGRWSVGTDIAYSYTRNFFGAASIGTPNVMLDRDQLAAYLTPYVGAAPAAALADTMTMIPLGIVTPANASDPTALLNLRHQGGSFSRVGVDIDIAYLLATGWTVSGNYSWVNRDSIGSAGGSDMAVLSAPRNKGALALRYHAPTSWWGVWAQGVAVETYPVKSGVFQGTIPGYAVMNLGATMQVPGRREVSLAVTATNLFDHVHQEYVGAPAIGRLVTARLEAEF